MVKSIRGRLQLWYAFVLLVVIGGFAGILYLRVRAERLRQVDEQLEGAARYLEASLRGFPPMELEGSAAPGPPFRPRDGREGPGGPRPGGPEGPRPGGGPDGPRPGGPDGPRPGGRPGPPLERLMADLNLPPNLRRPPDDDGPPLAYFIVWKTDGKLLKSSEPRSSDSPPPSATEAPRFQSLGSQREAILLGPRKTFILVGRSIEREMAELDTFAWQLAGIASVVLVVGLLGGWLISSQIVRPIAAISATASTISATNLSGRINPGDLDGELVPLAGVLNDTFSRLEAEFERQARFTADASHELRTPLAILQANVELALARTRSPEEYRQTLTSCLQASGRLRSLLDGLLTLARADAGRLDIARRPLDLTPLIEEVVDQHRSQANECGIALTAMLPDGPLTVEGDGAFLGRVLANLLSNALRHTPRHGRIEVALAKNGTAALLTVTDTGCGIPEEDQPKVFERFFRVDKARSRAAGGSGLGLAICKSLVEAHDGTISFQSQPNAGTTFTVRLPFAEHHNGVVGR